MRKTPPVCFVTGLAMMSVAHLMAQQGREPRAGYIFPAGAQAGTTVELTVGGQYLDDTQGVLVSGSGVKATVLTYNKPLPGKRFNELRDYLSESRKKLVEAKADPPTMRNADKLEWAKSTLKEAGATDDEIRMFLEMRKERNDPKRQPNPQLSESVTISAEVAANAQAGVRELRLLRPAGVSNPLYFSVGHLPEQTGSGQAGRTVTTATRVTLPAVINGQIAPGGSNRYAFQARQGQRLVIAVQARDLIPYLADAVPGWFQPVVTLFDAKGREVAYADHFRFSPDPVLNYDVAQDGLYLLEVRDALYRGREDFVYRITAGEIPFVTGFFPLGGKPGTPTTVELAGWNLPRNQVTLPPRTAEGVQQAAELGNGFATGAGAFAIDDLPQLMESEPNNKPGEAMHVPVPVIINGRINRPGEVDVFVVSCKAGEKVIAETYARRLNSPLDPWLKATDASGKQVAFNDDEEDKGSGLLTHSADSRLSFTATASGPYYIHLGDAQGKGGSDYGYRLRISPPVPDFALRIVPSSINARPGTTVPVTVYALRKDGFNGDITFAFKNAPPGFQLDGGCIPAGQDKVRATITIPQNPPENRPPTTARPSASAGSTPAGTPKSTPPTSMPAASNTPAPGPARTAPPVAPFISASPSSAVVKTTPPAAASAIPAAVANLPSASPAPASLPTPTPAPPKWVSLTVEGQASAEGRIFSRLAVPADDRTQAFMYHHLVPAKEFFVVTTGAGRGRQPLKFLNPSPLKVPAGGVVQTTLVFPVNQKFFQIDETKLQLSEPPDGITVEGFSLVKDGAAISFKADGVKAKPGLKGNLLVEMFSEKAPPSKDGKPATKKRSSTGFLPAISFEVVNP